ncbi:MAG TPA: PKD domain-containing protein [Saprospiraceae bacterium]|nr:PKD domain-containing protein [Saprospiraceae bacterium]HMQ84595.1 PKD domain-containing protein [Saprospiraceae bacterium]
MNILKYGILLFSLLLFGQCQRIELPEPMEGNPIFTLSSQLGMEVFDFSAGEEGYLMRSSFETDSLGRRVYIGAFKREDCSPPCGPNIRFGFIDTLAAFSDPQNLLQPGIFPFYQPVNITYSFEYLAQFNLLNQQSTGIAPLSVHWDFGDNSQSTQDNPSHQYAQIGLWEVTLSATWPGKHSSMQQKQLDFNNASLLCSNGFTVQAIQGGSFAQCTLTGNPGAYVSWLWRLGPNPACGVNILSAIDPDSTQLLLLAEARGTAPFLYTWSTGENTAAILPNSLGTYCVSVTDSEGCTSSDCYSYNELTCAVFIAEQPNGLLSAQSFGIPPFSYLWSDGSTSATFSPYQPGNYCVTITDAFGCSSSTCHYALTLTDSLSMPSFSFGPLPVGNAYEVCLESVTASGCISKHCQTIYKPAVGSLESYGIDFDYSVELDSMPLPSSPTKGTVWVEWEDETGKSYNTAYGPQNGTSQFFEIIAVEDFENNENNQKTRKISIRFDCQLYDMEGAFFKTISGSGVIAVAYP